MQDIPSAAARARCLAELADALDQAQIAVERLSAERGDEAERTELLERIESARRATRTLRLAGDRRAGRTLPDWT